MGKTRGRSLPSPEQTLGFFKKTLADRAFFAVTEFGELSQLRLLGGGQMRRHFNVDAHMEIAMAIALDVFDALAFQPDHSTRLRAGWDFNRHFPIERGYGDFSAKGCLDETHGYLAQEIIAVALEDGVRLNMHDNVQIARWRPAQSGLAVAGRA